MKNEKNIIEIAKLADAIDLFMEWESEIERSNFFSACGLTLPEANENSIS